MYITSFNHINNIMKNSNQNLMSQEEKFNKSLAEFWKSKGVSFHKAPSVGGNVLNLYHFYRSVCEKGGAEIVSNKKLWKDVAAQFELPASCTSASFTLKNHYQKYLLAYEQQMLFGKREREIPELVSGRARKMVKKQNYINKSESKSWIKFEQKQQMKQTNSISLVNKTDNDQIMNHQIINNQLQQQVTKTDNQISILIQKLQNKNALNQTLYSLYQISQNISSISILMFRQLIQKLSKVIIFLIPVLSNQKLNNMKLIVKIVKQFASRSQTSFPRIIQQSQFFVQLNKIYNTNSQQQWSNIVLELIKFISKSCFNSNQSILKIIDFINNQKIGQIQQIIQILKDLIQFQDVNMEKILVSNLQYIRKLLLFPYQNLRSQAIQLLLRMSIMSENCKIILAKNHSLVSIIVSMMQSKYASEKVCKYTTNLMKNLLEYQGSKLEINKYQQLKIKNELII